MKNFSLSVMLVLATLYSTTSSAQKMLNEGMLKYNISIESSKGEKQIAGSLNGATLSVYLTKDKSRSEMISTPGTETTVFDNRSGKGFILKEYSGQKLMITITSENWVQKNQINTNLNFETQSGTIKIGGYVCKKAIAQSSNGKSYTVYYDPSIIVANKQYNNAFTQLAGLPVQYELSSGNLNFKYSLIGLTVEALNSGKFEAPKSGFRVMTYEENQQLRKGE
jgi:GLPGLI family protein